MYIRTHEGLGQAPIPSSALTAFTHSFSNPNRELTPLPGQGARDPKFNWFAAKEEERERATIAMQRGARNPGTVVQLASDLARQARSWSDLQNLVRKHVYGSHIAGNQQDAKLLINTAVNAYNKLRPGGDHFISCSRWRRNTARSKSSPGADASVRLRNRWSAIQFSERGSNGRSG